MQEKNITIDIKKATRRARRAFFVLVIFSALQIIGYGYMVNASVSHVVNRMRLEKETGLVVTAVSKLESTYFALQNNITIEKAQDNGYVSGGSLRYVDVRGLPVTVLSRSN